MCWLIILAVSMALSVLFLQVVIDGHIKTVYPAPQFSLDEMPDQSGTHALITGATSGIGKVMALELARKGAHVSTLTILTITRFSGLIDACGCRCSWVAVTRQKWRQPLRRSSARQV